MLTGADALGWPFIASKAIPPARLAALREGFDATVRDPLFAAEAAKMKLPLVRPVSGAEAARMVERIYAAQPALVVRVKEIVR